MALLSSVKTKITVEASRFRSAVSEFIVQTMGKSINYLIDKTDAIETQIEGASFASASVVAFSRPGGDASAINYTVPAGTSFVGHVTATNRSVTLSGGQVFNGTMSPGGSAQETTGIYLAAGESITVTSGASTGEVELAGIEISTFTITVP